MQSTRIHTATAAPSRIGNVLLVLSGSLFIALLAQVAVPVGPVPVSGQTLGVFLVAIALGPRRGVLAVALYLAQGIAGLPFFAGGTTGPAVLMGPTGGYLIGFLPAALIAGRIAGPGQGRPGIAAALLTIATATIYLSGGLWLSRFIGTSSVFQLGVAPFLFGDALKIGIATMAAPLAPRLIHDEANQSD